MVPLRLIQVMNLLSSKLKVKVSLRLSYIQLQILIVFYYKVVYLLINLSQKFLVFQKLLNNYNANENTSGGADTWPTYFDTRFIGIG